MHSLVRAAGCGLLARFLEPHAMVARGTTLEGEGFMPQAHGFMHLGVWAFGM